MYYFKFKKKVDKEKLDDRDVKITDWVWMSCAAGEDGGEGTFN